MISSVFRFPAAAVLALAAVVHAAPTDVFAPPITNPTTGTIWTVGATETVTWDVSQAPVNITNGIGTIRFRFDNIITPLILADGFNILDGKVNVVVPWVDPGSDYSIVLFGDSGDTSKQFAIRSA